MFQCRPATDTARAKEPGLGIAAMITLPPVLQWVAGAQQHVFILH